MEFYQGLFQQMSRISRSYPKKSASSIYSYGFGILTFPVRANSEPVSQVGNLHILLDRSEFCSRSRITTFRNSYRWL